MGISEIAKLGLRALRPKVGISEIAKLGLRALREEDRRWKAGLDRMLE